MKSTLTAVVMAGALLVSAADVYAMAWGGGRGHGQSNGSASYSGGPSASVPEPSTLYAAGSALGLLAGAGWYLRRRK
jgi:PEP-CTERM motif-containing protein